MSDQSLNAEKPGRTTSALSEESRKSRRTLIAIATLWVAIVYLELTPTKISFLDIDLQEAKVSPAVLIAGVAQYFWLSFLIYGFTDWIAWYRGISSGLVGHCDGIERRERANNNALMAIARAEEEGLSSGAKVLVKWPDETQEQEIPLGQLQTGLSYWLIQSRMLRQERRIFVLDASLRTIWEFLLPFGSGLLIFVWFVLHLSSRTGG